MALKKKITRDTGITTTYHKIKSIDINEIESKCVVCIEEYLDESFRNKAKDINTIKEKINDLYEKAEESNNKETANALIEKANTLMSKNEDSFNLKYFVKEKNIILDYIPEDRTVRGFYNELKKIPEYADSEEV